MSAASQRIASSFRLRLVLTTFVSLLLVALSALSFMLVARVFDRMTPAVRTDLSDDRIRAIAATGGVIGIHFYSSYMGSPPTLDAVIDNVDHIAKLVGIDHVGLGPDVNGIDDDQWPAEMNHIGDLPLLTAELLRRGYDEPQLRKLYSDNLRGVYARCLPV